MDSKLRPELSSKNKYWISKHRYYELKHFCFQYKQWKKELSYIDGIGHAPTDMVRSETNLPADPVARNAIAREYLRDRIRMIETAAKMADDDLAPYILTGVTEGLSYDQQAARGTIPCSRDTYYDRYRKFFYILSHSRN